MAVMIKTVSLTKRYGTLVALSNLNLEIHEGDCFGFIGPNGAGKSTTIKILATLLQPTWGEARICDFVIGYQSRQIRPLIGYVPDYFGAYEDMVVQEYLDFFAAAYNINGPNRTKIVNDVLELTDLAYKRDALVDGLSRGMKQRLSIARVLVHDPKVLLLDEPAGNLDPRARIEMRELLKELQRMGKTILISSHILPELQDLCNKVGIIEQGELIYSGPWTDVVRQARGGMVLHVSVGDEQQEQAAALLSQDENVLTVNANNGYMEVSLRPGVEDYSFIPARLCTAGFKLKLLKEEEVNLETAFMRLTKGMVQQDDTTRGAGGKDENPQSLQPDRLLHMGGDETYYHGTDAGTVLELLNGAPLDATKAAALKIDGPPGFFLSTHVTDAEFFAMRRGRGTLLRTLLSRVAIEGLMNAGAVRRAIPRSAKSPRFRGDELQVPPAAFDLFNTLRSAGEIRLEPMP